MTPQSARLKMVYDNLICLFEGQEEEVRIFNITVPDIKAHLVHQWRDRRLGYALPPGLKRDGVHPSKVQAALQGKYAAIALPYDVDGVWDFRDPYGLVFVSAVDLWESESGRDQDVEFVMATDSSRVQDFQQYVFDLAAEYRQEHRQIEEIGEGLYGFGHGQRIEIDPADVILPSGMRETLLADVATFLGDQEWYVRHRLHWRRGILVYGPPGNGKTTLGRLLASEFFARGYRAYTYTITRETNLQKLASGFSRVKGPALVIMEDVDSITESELSRTAFLNFLDGGNADLRNATYVFATTNFPERVDGALVGRAGRLDRSFYLPNPSPQLRRAYLERHWTPEHPAHRLLDIAVRMTDGLGLASLNELHYAVSMRVRDGHTVTERDVEEIARSMRRVAKAKETGRWEGDPERRVGFAPSPSPWGDADEDRVAPLNGHGD